MADVENTLRERHRPAHAERTAQTHAAFLLPHLRPGMALLDLGCGPGSITAGLAAAVAPGPVTGVDTEPPDRLDGVTLVRADAADLPLPDASFDAVFASALLQHVPDPLAVLREARRVARPGAVIGVVDADWSGRLLEPSNDLLEESYPLMEVLRTGSPYVGRQLRGLLHEAGFARCEAGARAIAHGSADEVASFAGFNRSWFTNESIVDSLVRRGVTTPARMAEIAAAWAAWGEEPGAFFAAFWCEAVAWV